MRTAESFCGAVHDAFLGGDDVVLHAEDVKAVDAVGLAVLVEAARYASKIGRRWTVVPGPLLHDALLESGLLDEVAIGGSDVVRASADTLVVPPLRAPGDAPLAITSDRVTLRFPGWNDLACFERWAHDAVLDEMVASSLLYRCRHLGPYHADVVRAISADPTSLTALIIPPGTSDPVGFVRLYNVNLVERFAFLETAVVHVRTLRRGLGVAASRLFVAYGMDTLRLERVEAKAYAYNVLSVNALTRNGFVREGRLRQARCHDGRRWDLLVFGIVREEMLAQRARDALPTTRLWPWGPTTDLRQGSGSGGV